MISIRIIKKTVWIIIIQLIISCCCPTKKIDKIHGVYLREHYGNLSKIIVNKDSSFLYYVNAGMLNDTVKGVWDIKDCNKLIFNKKPNSFHEFHTCDTCNSNLVFKVFSLNKKDPIYPNYKVYKKGKIIENKYSETDNVIDIGYNNFDSVKFEFVGYEPYVYKSKINNHIVQIYMAEQALFDKRVFKIVNNKIITQKGVKLKKEK